MLNSILEFAGNHPFLAWCALWGIWPICGIFTTPFNVAFRSYNRHCRSKNIATRGWPTNPLMDADGDIIHPKETEA